MAKANGTSSKGRRDMTMDAAGNVSRHQVYAFRASETSVFGCSASCFLRRSSSRVTASASHGSDGFFSDMVPAPVPSPRASADGGVVSDDEWSSVVVGVSAAAALAVVAADRGEDDADSRSSCSMAARSSAARPFSAMARVVCRWRQPKNRSAQKQRTAAGAVTYMTGVGCPPPPAVTALMTRTVIRVAAMMPTLMEAWRRSR